MHITLIQTDIIWEDKQANLRRLQLKLEELQGGTDLVVLPETFTTGFSMHTDKLAEPAQGTTINLLQQYSSKYGIALAGSLIVSQGESFRNRFFFLTPEGKATYYDKRHLFRMGNENQHFTAGTERPIIRYHKFNILPQICYDLRFPVWSRNVKCEYDLLIYVACWPASRRLAWDTLLRARAIENQCYVCGVNRVGTDGNGIRYNGGSAVYSPKGECIAGIPEENEGVATIRLDLESLHTFRQHFPVWQDADLFQLTQPTLIHKS